MRTDERDVRAVTGRNHRRQSAVHLARKIGRRRMRNRVMHMQHGQPLGFGDFQLTNAAGGNFYVTWQGGGVFGGCPAATPTRNTTWGSVKALYR